MRLALDDAAPLYREAPEAEAARAGGTAIIQAFMTEALPLANAAKQRVAGQLIEATLTQVGSSYSKTLRTDYEIDVFAGEMADMFDAYLKKE